MSQSGRERGTFASRLVPLAITRVHPSVSTSTNLISAIGANIAPVAGHVAWAVIDLLQHPDELAKVRREQPGVLDGQDALSTKLIHRMYHLDRALHETERLHPVAFMLARHAAQEFELDEYRIRK
jgi:sterol 14-demethylase